MNNILKYLKPKSTDLRKIRLGPNQDGGYVVPEFALQNCSALFTYGVGNEIGFEVDFTKKYNKPVYTFDHTISWTVPSFLNHKLEGLGFKENCDDFINHYVSKNISGEVFLKVDIEGAEYDYFNRVDHDFLGDKVMGLCLEIHWLDNKDYQKDFIEMMDKLSKYFTLIHTHANNWGDLFNYEGYEIYNVYELTFINNKYIGESTNNNEIYPIDGLDYPNNPSKPDFKFNFFNEK